MCFGKQLNSNGEKVFKYRIEGVHFQSNLWFHGVQFSTIEVILKLSLLVIKSVVKMKVLQTLEKAFTFAIIRENSSALQRYLHRIQKLIASFNYLLGPIFLILTIHLDAKTFEEYEEIFYPLATLVTAGLIFMVYIWNRSEIFGMIDHFNEIIESSKFLIGSNFVGFLYFKSRRSSRRCYQMNVTGKKFIRIWI